MLRARRLPKAARSAADAGMSASGVATFQCSDELTIGMAVAQTAMLYALSCADGHCQNYWTWKLKRVALIYS
jgi:hypothetical protein